MDGSAKLMQVRKLLDLRRRGMLKVNPEYQRGAVWTTPQKKRLIDSVMRGYPIPLLYLHQIKDEVDEYSSTWLEVIDGQQRLNALEDFKEGAFKLFDPVADEKDARFPAFVKELPCPWGGKTFDQLDPTLQQQFLEIELSVVEITSDEPNEARDLFIRLQAGTPLNAQEQRDAWPGEFTEFILKLGGKPKIAKYPGHEFFAKCCRARTESQRVKMRTLAAQLLMLLDAKWHSRGERLADLSPLPMKFCAECA